MLAPVISHIMNLQEQVRWGNVNIGERDSVDVKCGVEGVSVSDSYSDAEQWVSTCAYFKKSRVRLLHLILLLILSVATVTNEDIRRSQLLFTVMIRYPATPHSGICNERQRWPWTLCYAVLVGAWAQHEYQGGVDACRGEREQD